MKIGFDLDKIFIDYPPFVPDHLIDKLYKKKTPDRKLLYRIPPFPEQWFRYLTHVPLLRAPIKENIAYLITLPKRHQLYLVSSRFAFLQGRTNKLLKRHKFDTVFTQTYFNYKNQQPHEFKNEVIKKLKLDYYIDDDLPLLKHVAKDNKHTIFFWLNPTQNRQVKKNIYAITKLSDIDELIRT